MTQVHFLPSKPLHSCAVPALEGCTEGSRSEPNEAAWAEPALKAIAVATIVAASSRRAISEVRMLDWVMVVLRFILGSFFRGFHVEAARFAPIANKIAQFSPPSKRPTGVTRIAAGVALFASWGARGPAPGPAPAHTRRGHSV